MEPRGVSPTRFLSKVDPQFLCPVCRCVSREPVVCSHCSTVYCSVCLPRQKCPSCSATRFEPLSGVALKMYNGLTLRCKCGKELTLVDMDRHASQCRVTDTGDDQITRLNKVIADLTSENSALKLENRSLREEVAALRGKNATKPEGGPAVGKADVQPKKRAEPHQKVHATPPPKASIGQEDSKSPAVVPIPQGRDKRPQAAEKHAAVPSQPSERRPSYPPQPSDKPHPPQPSDKPHPSNPSQPSDKPHPSALPQAIEKRPGGPPQAMDRRPAQPVEKRPAAPPTVPHEEKKSAPEAAMNQAATTIQRAFRMKKARELRAALQEKRAERMQNTGFKKKRNEAMAAFKNVQQVVQNLNIPTPKAGIAGK